MLYYVYDKRNGNIEDRSELNAKIKELLSTDEGSSTHIIGECLDSFQKQPLCTGKPLSRVTVNYIPTIKFSNDISLTPTATNLFSFKLKDKLVTIYILFSKDIVYDAKDDAMMDAFKIHMIIYDYTNLYLPEYKLEINKEIADDVYQAWSTMYCDKFPEGLKNDFMREGLEHIEICKVLPSDATSDDSELVPKKSCKLITYSIFRSGMTANLLSVLDTILYRSPVHVGSSNFQFKKLSSLADVNYSDCGMMNLYIDKTSKDVLSVSINSSNDTIDLQYIKSSKSNSANTSIVDMLISIATIDGIIEVPGKIIVIDGNALRDIVRISTSITSDSTNDVLNNLHPACITSLMDINRFINDSEFTYTHMTTTIKNPLSLEPIKVNTYIHKFSMEYIVLADIDNLR